MPQVDKTQQDSANDLGFQCHMKDCAAIGEGRKLFVNGQLCAMQLLALMGVASIAFSALH